ncbi:MAG: hypothetical protein A6F70_09315 [Cycloclasticus sp. symbiont of Bathymodiolus heckerae]|nr:MAG: hypothetical protein A6F70_09315 [Cycloclasticus sp. symbiont of Bathymodiolus heckerae]
MKDGHKSTELERSLLDGVSNVIAFIIEQETFLRNKANTYQLLFEKSTDPMLIMEHGQFIDCNEAAVQMMGYSSQEELLNTKGSDLSPGLQPDGRESVGKAREAIATTYSEGSNRFEWNYCRKGGQPFPVEVIMTAIMDGDREVLHFIWRDIAELKKQQVALKELAHYDNLTGLPNRVLFADHFELAVAQRKRSKKHLVVCFVDIDNFKPVNDGFGHDVGDKLLIQIANRMTASVRDEDTVSRAGGDEFTLLLGGLESYLECEQLVQRILNKLSEPYIIGEHEFNAITASIGISIYPNDGSDVDIDSLVRHADHAMYDAKESGKNRYSFFDADTARSSQEHQLFLTQVSKAITSNEFVLYYQPKINMRTGKMFGAEALIRWEHPTEGLLPPLSFLPKIEHTAAIIDIGHWVLDQALIQIEKWVKEDKSWVVSINIDAYHFTQAGFIDELKRALALHPAAPPELLEIEILETVAFDDLKRVATLIHDCQTLGVSFSLDDFGTGYSSLAYLKALPVERLKIDRSFVRDMLEDEQDLALIEGIISLSKAFKREVIAEGVESTEHGIELMKLGCENAQGYAIAKPMPAKEILSWEEKNQPNTTWLGSIFI